MLLGVFLMIPEKHWSGCHVPVVMDVEQVMEKVYIYVVCVVWHWAVPVIGKNADGDCDETSNDWDEGACVERCGLE